MNNVSIENEEATTFAPAKRSIKIFEGRNLWFTTAIILGVTTTVMLVVFFNQLTPAESEQSCEFSNSAQSCAQ